MERRNALHCRRRDKMEMIRVDVEPGFERRPPVEIDDAHVLLERHPAAHQLQALAPEVLQRELHRAGDAHQQRDAVDDDVVAHGMQVPGLHDRGLAAFEHARHVERLERAASTIIGRVVAARTSRATALMSARPIRPTSGIACRAPIDANPPTNNPANPACSISRALSPSCAPGSTNGFSLLASSPKVGARVATVRSSPSPRRRARLAGTNRRGR